MISTQPRPLLRYATESQPVIVAYGTERGGLIWNPLYAADQGISVSEPLNVSIYNPATPANPATMVIQPGQFFRIPAGFRGQVSVWADTRGHKFSGVIYHDAQERTPSDNPFPPTGPVTLTEVIYSYLYLQYDDDEDLVAFVDAYNAMAQQYVSWFAEVALPVYAGNPMVVGALLDWVAQGLYGMIRPALPAGLTQNLGMFNTVMFNSFPLNAEEILGPASYYFTDDDVFKRILTWHIYKGDGKLFDVRWLKRRVMRFLTGVDGTEGETDATYPVSITFGVGNQVNINLQSTYRYGSGGSIIGFGMYNDFVFNELDTFAVSVPVSPMVPVFKSAVEAGVLELPFQFDWVVNVN